MEDYFIDQLFEKDDMDRAYINKHLHHKYWCTILNAMKASNSEIMVSTVYMKKYTIYHHNVWIIFCHQHFQPFLLRPDQHPLPFRVHIFYRLQIYFLKCVRLSAYLYIAKLTQTFNLSLFHEFLSKWPTVDTRHNRSCRISPSTRSLCQQHHQRYHHDH